MKNESFILFIILEFFIVYFILNLKNVLIFSQISFIVDFIFCAFIVCIFCIYPIILIKQNVWLIAIHSGVTYILLTSLKDKFCLTNRIYVYLIFLFLLSFFITWKKNKRINDFL